MATYNLWVTTTAIHQIRSNDQDTLIASMGLGVTGLGGGPHNMLTPAESMQLGTHVAGDLVEIFLLFQNVDVPDPTPEFPDGGAISWSFLLVNGGAGNMAEIVAAATTAGDIIAKAVTPTGPVGVFVGATITAVDALARLLLTGCDGAVASQNWVITAAQLAASGELGWNDTQNYPGSQSPLACGAPSSYDVSYTITAHPPVTIPAFGGTSAQGAAQWARELGLSIQIAQEVASDRIDVPTIESTQPGPGTLVPVGTVLDAVLAIPGQPEGGGGDGGGVGGGDGGGHRRP
jgi:hypothetical protein